MEVEPNRDLYKRTPPDIFIRMDGVYYKWVLGKGWGVIAEPANIVNWDTLHEVQRKVYHKALVEQGLIKAE